MAQVRAMLASIPHLTSRHCAREERTFFWVSVVTSLLTARRSPARRACSSATAWNCTIKSVCWGHSHKVLLERASCKGRYAFWKQSKGRSRLPAVSCPK